jgi:hypothetical protein
MFPAPAGLGLDYRLFLQRAMSFGSGLSVARIRYNTPPWLNAMTLPVSLFLSK